MWLFKCGQRVRWFPETWLKKTRGQVWAMTSWCLCSRNGVRHVQATSISVQAADCKGLSRAGINWGKLAGVRGSRSEKGQFPCNQRSYWLQTESALGSSGAGRTLEVGSSLLILKAQTRRYKFLLPTDGSSILVGPSLQRQHGIRETLPAGPSSTINYCSFIQIT